MIPTDRSDGRVIRRRSEERRNGYWVGMFCSVLYLFGSPAWRISCDNRVKRERRRNGCWKGRRWLALLPRDNKRRKERMEAMRRGRKGEEERKRSRKDRVKRKEDEVKRDKGVDSHANVLIFLIV